MTLNIFGFDLNKYTVLTALLCNSEDFCANWSHFESLSTSDFARDGTRFHASGTERHQRRRERVGGYVRLSPMKSSLIRNAENPDCGATGILSKAIDKHPAGIPQPLFEEIVIFRSRFVVSPPVHLGVGNGWR